MDASGAGASDAGTPGAAPSGVEVRGVTASYGVEGRRVPVLRDVSLTVGLGEFVSVIGPSGCGKSTLLRVVAGLLPADSGSVTVDGEPVAAAASEKRIGLVPQSPALLPWRTVLDNVRLPLQVNRRANAGREPLDARQLLTDFGLGSAMDLHPGQLSGGMQQRVAIARAFVFEPSIMLMDEPFSALDEINRDIQRAALLEFWQSNRRAVLFVTHSISEAIMLSDRIVVMAGQPGRVDRVIDVDLPRPRTAEVAATDAFRELATVVRGALHSPQGMNGDADG